MSEPRRKTTTGISYTDYIRSPAWRATRERYWQSKLPHECYCCGAARRPGMHLHHRTYKRLGAERLTDLVPVCPDCHDAVHRLHRDPIWRRRGLWATTNAVRKMRGGRFAAAQKHRALMESKGLQLKMSRRQKAARRGGTFTR